MTRPIILLDVDGVLADFTTPVLEWANACANARRFEYLQNDGANSLYNAVKYEDITDYDITKAFPTLNYKEIFVPCMRQGWCRALRPLPGAIEAVKALQALGEVYAVTKPFDSPYWVNERYEWLGQVVGIPRSRVHFCEDKFMVRGDVLVEDSGENLLGWWRASTDYEQVHPLLWSQPWNRNVEGVLNSWRVTLWETVIQVVEGLT